MRVIYFLILLFALQSCTTKKYTKIKRLPEGIKSATEEIYTVVNNQKKLLQKKEMVFTRNGRIKYSKTVDAQGNLLQETEKKLWFTVESYPDREPYYCKTRWKTGQRERISCYTKKQYKQNEAIYHYNKDGTINKIVDNFTTFDTQYFYYTNNELSKIVIKDKNDKLIDEILISCETKDEKGACLKEIRISTKTNNKEEILFTPVYYHS
jgi:ferritin-like protein